MATVTALRKPKITVGSLIDQLQGVRAQRRAIAAQDKALSTEYEALQTQLLALMDSEGITKSTGQTATASISENDNYNVTDWDAFWAYMVKTKQGHLIQRRISAPSVRELWSKKGVVPGLTPYVKREIGLRDL